MSRGLALLLVVLLCACERGRPAPEPESKPEPRPVTRLRVEWLRADYDGSTCDRCTRTRATLKRLLPLLEKELGARGVRLTYVETPVGYDRSREANLMRLNGKPIEELLPNAFAEHGYCTVCSHLVGRETYCRVLRVSGKRYTDLPEAIIRQAVARALLPGSAGASPSQGR